MKRFAALPLFAVAIFFFGILADVTASASSFSPNKEKAALLKLLDEPPNSPGDINKLNLFPSSVDSTWVRYEVAIPVSAGGGVTQEDWATGYAHFLHGRWLNVLGPGTRFCVGPSPFKGIPATIQKSLNLHC
jgi:hypothetical protein